MKALDEYFLMVVFTLLLNRAHVFHILCLIWIEKHGSERINACVIPLLAGGEGFDYLHLAHLPFNGLPLLLTTEARRYHTHSVRSLCF